MQKKNAESIPQLHHLNTILRAIRNVNQLIVTEKDPGRLIRKTCRLLSGTEGFLNAWIVLFDEKNRYRDNAQSGIGKDFTLLTKLLKNGKRVHCIRKATAQQAVLAIKNPSSVCTDCPLRERYTGESALTTGLYYKKKTYGVLTVSVKKEFLPDNEARELLKEVAGDIAFALYTIDIETAHEQARKAIKISEARFRTTLYSIGDAVLTTDKKGRVQQMNPVAEQLTGWKEAEAIGKPLKKIFKIINEESRKTVENPVERVLREGIIVGLANHTLLISKSGKEIPIADSGAPVWDDSGKISGVVLVFHDQTTERESQKVSYLLSSVVKSSFDAIISMKLDGTIISWNKAAESIFGYTEQEMLGQPIFKIVPSALTSEVSHWLKRIKKGEHLKIVETTRKHKDGHLIYVALTISPVKNDNGKVVGVSTIARDITERKKVEETLRKSEDRLKKIMIAANDGMWDWNLKTNEVYFDRCYYEMAGYEADEFPHHLDEFEKRIHPDDTSNVMNEAQRHLEGETERFVVEFRFRKKNKDWLWIMGRGFIVERDESGAPLRFVGTHTDITQRKLASERLRQYKKIVESTSGHMSFIDVNYIYQEVNNSYLKAHNKKREEIVGHSVAELMGSEVFENDIKDKLDACLSGEIVRYENWFDFAESGKRYMDVCYYPYFDENHKVTGIIVDSHDITLHKQAEAERERLSIGIEYAAEAVVITDTDGDIQYVNPAFEQVTGYSKEEALGQNPRILKSGEHEQAFYTELWNTITGGNVWRGKFFNRRKNGELYSEETTISPVYNTNGTISNFVAVKRDVTKEEKLEQQFMQAQKMESVGRLAGGVAHDFNNMLSVILGYSELALASLGTEDKLYKNIAEIQKAGQRSADLTRQLLAFSRKQTIVPRTLNLNDAIGSMLKMLRRLIGEDINLAWKPGPNLGNIYLDPAQVDQLLANLCVNARDAIGGVGDIIIETKSIVFDENYCRDHTYAKPGAYIQLTISDNGCGMDKDVIDKIFEPFFTTKAQGAGTGLGLATVYGIVKQNHGLINVYSEPGEGTSFKLYFPLHEAAQENIETEEKIQLPRGNGELILLVEDETAILELTSDMIESIGYTVIATVSPEEALILAAEQEKED